MPLADKDNLHIPFPTWAKDGDVNDDRDFENWKELMRWADRLPGPTPLIFHWPGALADHVDVRNAPGEFGRNGTIWKIRYRWDEVPTGTATIEWELDTAPVFTDTLPASTDPHVEHPAQAYAQEAIAAIATADGGGVGLTAFVYLR